MTAPPSPDPTAADPFAARSPAVVALFSAYLRWYLARHFHALRVSRAGLPAVPEGRPVIVVSNHPSWWDPTLFVLAHRALLPGRLGFGPMEAAALRRYGVLARIGVFGVEGEGRVGAAGFLRASLRVLADPRSVLWVTAEGRFTDPRVRPVRLRPGVAHLARRVPGAVLLPLAVEYPFWNESRPEALLRFGRPLEAGRGRSAPEWTALLERELTTTMDALAAEAATRDPAPFRVLLQGGTGVGGPYDLWRRLRALAGGDRFDPAHEVGPALASADAPGTISGAPLAPVPWGAAGSGASAPPRPDAPVLPRMPA